MRIWLITRARKLALGWGLIITSMVGVGCWNTKPPGATLNNNRQIGQLNRTAEQAKRPAAANANAANPALNTANPGGFNQGAPTNARVSGNVPLDTSNRVGLNAGANPATNNGMPPHFNSIQPAGGLPTNATNSNGLTPIASNSMVSSPPVNLPVNLNNSVAMPAPDPTPGPVAPPAVLMQDQDPNFVRRNTPTPATEAPPNLNPGTGIQPPPGSPIRQIK